MVFAFYWTFSCIFSTLWLKVYIEQIEKLFVHLQKNENFKDSSNVAKKKVIKRLTTKGITKPPP